MHIRNRRPIKFYVKWFFLIFSVSLIGFIVIFRQELAYGIRQAKGQITILTKTQKINEILLNATVADSIKSKILLISQVKQFAEDSLGFKPSENYTTFYDQKGRPILWIVTAAYPFEMVPYEWKFPIIGKFSYKGYFDYRLAEAEANKLKNEGYDIRINEVSAWSTLGYFKDPILSNMLERETGSLAELIIHELTHHNLYIRDSVIFNENLASFIGMKGAEKFLKTYYGAESEELRRYQLSKREATLFRNYMLNAAKKLDSLYLSMSAEMDHAEKLALKNQTIKDIMNELSQIKFESERYKKINTENHLPNNTFFLSFVRYNDYESELDSLFQNQFDNDIRKMMDYFKSSFSSL